MHLIKNLIVVFLMLLTTSLSAQELSVDSVAKDYKLLDLELVSLLYPLDWEVDTSRKLGTEFILFSPLQNNDDLFLDNINLMEADLEGMDIDLDKFVSNTELQIQSLITKGKIIENKRINQKNKEYHSLIYSGIQGSFDLTFTQRIWLIDTTAYVLTFTCDTKQYAYYETLSKSILDSFLFK